jgi:hypothetical protein
MLGSKLRVYIRPTCKLNKVISVTQLIGIVEKVKISTQAETVVFHACNKYLHWEKRPYAFSGLDTLVRDFLDDVQRAKHER